MKSRPVLTLALLGTAILAFPVQSAQAQQTSSEVAVTVSAGPLQQHTQVGVRVQSMVSVVDGVELAPQGISRRRGVPQMVIGGIALVGGAIIGDDAGTIVSIAGLGYGLYGLYLYLH